MATENVRASRLGVGAANSKAQITNVMPFDMEQEQGRGVVFGAERARLQRVGRGEGMLVASAAITDWNPVDKYPRL